MTSKERLLRALHKEKPDRLPATLHQWQPYHLNHYMDGMDELTAFQTCGLDASCICVATTGQYLIPQTGEITDHPSQWKETIELTDPDPNNKTYRHTVETPDGILTWQTSENEQTRWITEHLIKKPDDLDLIASYMPVPRLDKQKVADYYNRIGDAGILRGLVWGEQPGCWQHACCLMDTSELILKAIDDPEWVHRLLQTLLEKKLAYIEDSLTDARFDLIETGGGSGSDTVISPKIHREFCLPYDRQMHRALHKIGHLTTYHTCGGMMHLLDLIPENETDASETLSPPGTGGNISDPEKVRQAFTGKVAMIGGLDQFNVLTNGTPEQIHTEIHRLFEGFGQNGGYICSASDHFFDAPPENLHALARAARQCHY